MQGKQLSPSVVQGTTRRSARRLRLEYSQCPANDPAVDLLRPGDRTEQLSLARRNEMLRFRYRLCLQAAYFVPPTVFVDVPTDAPVWREEIFGARERTNAHWSPPLFGIRTNGERRGHSRRDALRSRRVGYPMQKPRRAGAVSTPEYHRGTGGAVSTPEYLRGTGRAVSTPEYRRGAGGAVSTPEYRERRAGAVRACVRDRV